MDGIIYKVLVRWLVPDDAKEKAKVKATAYDYYVSEASYTERDKEVQTCVDYMKRRLQWY